MSNSERLTVTETARLVRAALKREFPDVKFSVRSNKYAGGAAVDVGWTDGPQISAVDKVTGPYEGARFDSMADMKSYLGTWLFPDGTAQRARDGEPVPGGARLVHSGADYVITHRTFSGEYRAWLEQVVTFLTGEPAPFSNSKRYGFALSSADKWFEDWGGTVVRSLSEVDEAAVEAALEAEAKRRAGQAHASFSAEHPEGIGFYVSVVDGRQSGVLFGPYATKEEADAEVELGRRLARKVNSRAIWYAYGTCKVTMKPGDALPVGALEHLVERQMQLAGITYPMAEAA